MNTFFYESSKIIAEKELWNESVLIFNDVVDDNLDGTDLIVSQSVIDCRSIIELILIVSLANLILIEQWEFFLEILIEIITEDVFHGPWVETEDTHHVGTI